MKSLIAVVCLAGIGCGGYAPTSRTPNTSPVKQGWYITSYDHGKKSYDAGLKPENNPFISNGHEAAAWLDGYLAAKEEFRKKEAETK